MVERVRLALAALLAAHVDHGARVLGHLGLHDAGGVVRTGVVDHADRAGGHAGSRGSMSRSMEAPMTAASFQAGIRMAVRGRWSPTLS